MVIVNDNIGEGYHMDGYLKEILDGFKFAVQDKMTSVVGITDGRSGMGKTTLSMQSGRYLDPNMSLDQVYYKPEDFLTGLSKAKKGTFHLFDEAMLISSRNSLSHINKMIIIAMSMIRSKQIYVWFCVNSIFDLDKNLALSRADILLNVYGDNLIDRGKYRAFFKAAGQEDKLKELYLIGKQMYSYSKPKANFIARFSARFLFDNELYEARKQKAINEYLLKSEKPIRPDRYAIPFDKLCKHCIEKGYTQEKLSEITGVPRQTISERLANRGKASEIPLIMPILTA